MQNRKNQGRWLKIITTIMLAASIALPYLFCGILGMRIVDLEKQMKELKSTNVKSLEIVWSDDEGMDMVASKKEEMAPDDITSDIPDKDENDSGGKDSVVNKEQSSEEEKSQEEVIEDEYAGFRKVYLTFDDGPSIYTERILEILKRYNVKATFFVTGTRAVQYEEKLQKIAEEGHALANHSYSHVYKDVYASLESFQEDFYKLNNFIKESTGEDVKIYRFPGGSANTGVTVETRTEILKWMKEEGIRHFDWNVSSGDGAAELPTPEEIAQRCIDGAKNLKDTVVVLMHDSSAKKNTIEALPLIIEGISQLENTVFLPIDENTRVIQQRSLTEE